jgi:radical SAM protein with 4Fe4S-binding SPASM domain
MHNISLEISNPCNEHCIHCYRICKDTKLGFLSAIQTQSVLEQAKALGAVATTITGGESLLNPEWKEIVRIADELGFCISFFSNGSLMKESDADFLATVKNLKEVQLSLYALEKSIHDSITNLKGSCKGTKNAIYLLRERNVPIFVSCPVIKENKTAVLDVMRWCDNEGIPSCADIFIFGDSAYTGKNLVHRLSWGDLQDFFEETMKDDGKLSYVWGNGHGDRDLTKIEFYGGAVHSLCVSGDGTIFPEIGWYEPLGNIATDTLKDIFENHPLLKELRKIYAADIEECRECKCADFCDFCFTTHITANHGELRKIDSEYCKFVEFRKQKAYERDKQLKR